MRKGMTSQPCHGCGTTDPHPAGKLCRSCQSVLEEAHALRQHQAQDADRTLIYVPNEWPYINIPGYRGAYPNAINYRLAQALTDIIWRNFEPSTHATVRKRSEYHSPDRTLFPSRTESWKQHSPVLATPSVIDRIRELDSLLEQALNASHQGGVAAGSDLLRRLAADRIAIDDFNKKTATGDPSAEVRRVWRD